MMKNKICLIILAVFTVSIMIASCGSEKNTIVSVDTEFAVNDTVEYNETEILSQTYNAETEDKVSKDNKESASIEYIKEEIEFYDESGKILLLTGRIVYPVVSLSESGKAEKKINDYFALQTESYFREADRMLAESKELLENLDTEYWNTFVYNSEYRTEMIGERYLSFVCRDDTYIGGAHSMPDERGIVFDTQSGDILSLDDMFRDTEEFRSFALMNIVPQIDKENMLDGNLENVSGLIDNRTAYFDREGIVFICNVYVLYPYAYGINYFRLPYEDISEHLTLSVDGGVPFSRFYGFDIDGDDTSETLGYIDRREALSPYDETDKFIIEGENPHAFYVVPKYKESNIYVERAEYNEAGEETFCERIYSVYRTNDGYCLKVVCPMTSGASVYRVIIEASNMLAQGVLEYSSDNKMPVTLIK
ncbi:MAG: DUF4163 domain-containing protein [Clostridia bacterium]|nr:DUF4163 domain-containing protein [Clostridia bacterium]